MTDSLHTNAGESEEFMLGDLVRMLWAGKWIIIAITGVGSACGVGFALYLPDIYRAEALVQPRQEANSLDGLGAIAAQFGDLPNLGLSLGGGSDRDVAMATLRSRAVISRFIEEENLLPKLYSDAWDPVAGRWRDHGLEGTPTLWEAYNDFMADILKISDDRRTGLVTVAVEWGNPVEAAHWVTEIVARVNGHLKAGAIVEGERNLAYLEEQSQAIGQIALVQSVYGLVEQELKKLMLARGGNEFAFKTIDPAVVPMKRVRPNRTRVAIVGFLLGGMLGVAAVIARASLRKRQRT